MLWKHRRLILALRGGLLDRGGPLLGAFRAELPGDDDSLGRQGRCEPARLGLAPAALRGRRHRLPADPGQASRQPRDRGARRSEAESPRGPRAESRKKSGLLPEGEEDGCSEAGPSAQNAVIGMASWVQGGIDVDQVKGTNLLQLSCDAPTPKLAASIANAVAEAYIQWTVEAKSQMMARASQFFAGPDRADQEGSRPARAATACLRTAERHHLGRPADECHAAEARVPEPGLRSGGGGQSRQGGAVSRGRNGARNDRRIPLGRPDLLA